MLVAAKPIELYQVMDMLDQFEDVLELMATVLAGESVGPGDSRALLRLTQCTRDDLVVARGCLADLSGHAS